MKIRDTVAVGFMKIFGATEMPSVQLGTRIE